MSNPLSPFMAATLSFCLGVGSIVHAQTFPPAGIVDRDLVAQAIRSSDGKARVVVSGDQARAIENMTRSTEPIYASVTVLKRLASPDCARVELNLTQEKVPTTDGGFITFQMPPVQLSICSDGNPPR